MITSPSNPKVKNIVQLLSSGKVRREQNAYVVEGIKLFHEAPDEQLRQVFLTESCYERLKDKEKLAKTEYELVSDAVYKKMSDTQSPQGILCVMEKKSYDLAGQLQSLNGQAVHILLLEGIQDPGNLGTMLRTGEGAGIDFVLADEKTADVYNPKVIRSTMGSIFRIPVIYTADLKAAITLLKKENILLYAAHLHGENDFWEEAYAERTALLIGNEGNGLSDEISALADVFIKIPMQGKVESLNAAVAASIVMYEMQRQAKQRD